MKLKPEFSSRAFVVYLAALAVVGVLTEAMWGATVGYISGLSIARNPEYQEEVMSFMKDKGVDPDSSMAEALSVYQALPKEDKCELMIMSKEALSDINWFAVTVFVSVFVFGIVGFLGGIFARSWLLAGAVPVLSFLTHNQVIRFPLARDLPILEKVIVVIFAQFAVCSLFAYCGARVALKRRQKKKTANQTIEAGD